ncbi:YhdT family protein [Pantoea dispersa]|uniref:YhdT family protein n=1 Tax=Pantoea dispersa TaxID=59814 RepID=UPI001EE75B07|nr:YhdT family protein [Pantoea dispersa]UKY38387.1 YhdT family protein [Pantoea dispersa]
MDGRFLQANKEARWSLYLTLAYLAVWGVSAWLGGTQSGFTGLPRWFEFSCVFAPLLFIGLCWLMVRMVFRDMSLEDHDGN